MDLSHNCALLTLQRQQNYPSYEAGKSRDETELFPHLPKKVGKEGMGLETKEQELWFCIESTKVNEEIKMSV